MAKRIVLSTYMVFHMVSKQLCGSKNRSDYPMTVCFNLKLYHAHSIIKRIGYLYTMSDIMDTFNPRPISTKYSEIFVSLRKHRNVVEKPVIVNTIVEISEKGIGFIKVIELERIPRN